MGGCECEWVSHSGCGFVSVRKCHVIIMWNSNADIVEIPKLDATEDWGMIFTHTCLYSFFVVVVVVRGKLLEVVV